MKLRMKLTNFHHFSCFFIQSAIKTPVQMMKLPGVVYFGFF